MIYQLDSVTKTFGRRNHRLAAVRDLTLTISEQEQIALIGPSGSGKTTFFRLLNGSLLPSSGRVLYRKNDIRSMSDGQLRAMRSRVGCVYQQHYLVPGLTALTNTLSGALGRWSVIGTIRNLMHARADEVEYAEHCLEAVGLADKRGFPCEQLSGGQQQRLAIARTLMQRPEVILADEPVASLDPQLTVEILDLLVRLAADAGMTLITSLHQVDQALRHSKRIIAIREGTLAFDVATRNLDQHSLEYLYGNARERSTKALARDLNFPEEAEGSADSDHSDHKRVCVR